jgi:uncharacterized protein YndB with AHSA1/START domain
LNGRLMPYLIALIVAAIGSLFAVASRKPETFSVVRSTVINAPAERIFALINDFHLWASWSPFEKLDPAMNKTFSGPTSGAGASYAWTGNKKAGAGSMTISGDTPSSEVNIAMAFLKPFKSQSSVQFLIEPSGAAHQVTWTMSGKNQLASKVMSVFVSMDKMIGKDFAEGLANLKREVESSTD